MDDMVWRNTSKHLSNQSFIVSQLNSSNQLTLFSCNKMAQTLFNVKSTATFNKFLLNAQLNIGECVFNSRIFENLPFKKKLENLREYLLARHSKMQSENTNSLRNSQLKKSASQSEQPNNNQTLQAMKVAAQAVNKNNINSNSIFMTQFPVIADPGGRFDGRGGGGGGGGMEFRNYQRVPHDLWTYVKNFCIQQWRKMKCWKNKYKFFNRRNRCYSVDELTTNKGNDVDNFLYGNNNPTSMENIGNFYNFLDEIPSKSIDVDYLNCSIYTKEHERNYRISVFKYKGGPSGEKSPLLILCIEEIKKNDFMNLKEIILEKGHFITNILEFFSDQLKTQMSYLNDHLKYNYSSHSLQEGNGSAELKAIENHEATGSGSRAYNIAESQDITSKSLVDINKQIKYGKKLEKSNISALSKDPHRNYLQVPHEDENSPPNTSFQQKSISHRGIDEGYEQIFANNTFRGNEQRQNYLAPPPTANHQKSQSRGNTPEYSPTKVQTNTKGQLLEGIVKKRDTLDISALFNNNSIHPSSNILKTQNQIVPSAKNSQNQIPISVGNSINQIPNNTGILSNKNVNQSYSNNNPLQIQFNNNSIGHQQNNVNIIHTINNVIQNINNVHHSVPNKANTNTLNIKAHSNTVSHNTNYTNNVNNFPQQFQKLSPSIKGLHSTQDAIVAPSDKDIYYGLNQQNTTDKEQPVQQQTTSAMIQSKEQKTMPLIEAKKIVSEQLIQYDDEEEEEDELGDEKNSAEKEILSQDEIINDHDRKIFNKYHQKIIKYNKSLIEICHNAKLIALKSLIQISNYSDCYRHKESRALPLRINQFSISELILNTFYFNSKPILIYKSKYQKIRSDDRRLIQVIFNILNFLMKKTDQTIKFIVMDKEEYEMNKMNQSISKGNSPNPDTAKFINQNMSRMHQSHKGVENITEISHKKKETSHVIVLQDINNSDVSCNLESEPTPNAQQPNHYSDSESKVGQMKRLSEKKIDINNQQYNQSNSNNGQIPSSCSKISTNKEENNQLLMIRSSAGGTFTNNNITADDNKDFSQIERDTYMLTLGQVITNNVQTAPKLYIQTNPNGEDDFIDITQNKTNFNDLTPSNNMHQSNMMMITANNTQYNQESIPNISYITHTKTQQGRNFFDPSQHEEIVLDRDLDDENDNNLSQKMRQKKLNQKFTLVEIPKYHHQKLKIGSGEDEIFSENYCDSIVNENISNVVLKNLQIHKNEKNLRELKQNNSNNNSSRSDDSNKNQAQILQYHSSSQSKSTTQSIKQDKTITTNFVSGNKANNSMINNQSNNYSNSNNMISNNNITNVTSNLKAAAAANAAQFSSSTQQTTEQQLPYKKQQSYNQQTNTIMKENTGVSGYTSAISSSARLENKINKNKESTSLPPNKSKPITFFNNKNQKREEAQFIDQEQIFKNFLNQKSSSFLANESAQNLNHISHSAMNGMGKVQEILSPPIIGSPQNFNNSQFLSINQNKSNANLNCESPTNIDFQSSHYKVNPKSQFSKSCQQYPTVSQFPPGISKNQLQLQESQIPDDGESGINPNKNQIYSSPIEEDMLRSQNMMVNNSNKNVKMLDGLVKKKSSIKKGTKPYQSFSRANSNNSSIIRKQSVKSGYEMNNIKMQTSKRVSTAGINSRTLHISPYNEDLESNKLTYMYEKNASIRKNKKSEEADVIAIEIQMEGDNIKFSPDNNESIQMIATNEIIKLLGPNKKIQISSNRIAFFLYTNLDQREQVKSNLLTNCEKYEELLDLKGLMNPKAVDTIRQMNRAITIDNRTCKTIYTLENKPHNFALADEEQLETHQRHIQQQVIQNQHLMGNIQQNPTDFHSLHSLTKHRGPQGNSSNITRSQQQPYQPNYHKFGSLRQDSIHHNSGATPPNSKSFQTPQLNLQKLNSINNNNNQDSPVIGGTRGQQVQPPVNNGNYSLDNKLNQQKMYAKDNEYLQSYSQRSNLPSQQSNQQTATQNLYKSEKQSMNRSGVNQTHPITKIQIQKYTLDSDNNFVLQNLKLGSKSANTIATPNQTTNLTQPISHHQHPQISQTDLEQINHL